MLDYDDLLLYWAQMMAEPALAAERAARFDHVLVDEYQDTNRLQAAILLALKPDGRGLTVVGDDAQAIYAFRGATVRNILDFPGAVHAAGAHRHAGAQLPLDAGRSSTPPTRSSGWPASASPRTSGASARSDERPRIVTVADEADQARYVVEQVLERREASIALKSQAVLFRASSHSAVLETRTRPAQHPVRQVRRTEVPRSRAREGRARVPAPAAEPARSRRRLPRAAAAARRRPEDGVDGSSMRWRSADPRGRPRSRDAAARRRGRLGRVRVVVRPAARPVAGLARGARARHAVVRTAPAAPARRRRRPARRPAPARGDRGGLSRRASASSPSSRSTRRAPPATKPGRR